MTYQGKASALGLKTVGELVLSQEHTSNRWYELPLPKSLSIVRCATGHDGLHAVFLDAEGTAFFAGLARRGEDGDLSKSVFKNHLEFSLSKLCCSSAKHRRQPKSSRPKRFSSMEGKSIVDIACNNGTSALVTKEGELFLFGKDSTFCDSTTGNCFLLIIFL